MVAVWVIPVDVYIEYMWVPWVLSAAILCVILWVNIGSPAIRRRRLKKPSRASFIETINGQKVEKTEISRPAHSEGKIQLEHQPKLKFSATEILFGFHGEVSEKPQPTEYFNDFIREGFRQGGAPDKNHPTHAVDIKGNYHIREDWFFTPGNAYTVGFKIATAKPGRYKVRWVYFTDEGEGIVGENLTLIVE